MSKQYIDINRLVISMVAMLVCSFVFSLSGFNWFMMNYDIPLLHAINQFVTANNLEPAYAAIFLTFNALAVLLISSNNYTATSAKLFFPIYFVMVAVSYSDMKFLADCFTFIFAFFVARNTSRLGVVLRFLESYLLLMTPYQYLSMYIKTGGLALGDEIGIIGATIFYVDYIVFLFVLCVIYKKGSATYEQEEKGSYLVVRFLFERVKNAWRNRKDLKDFQKVLGRKDWKKSDLALLYAVQVGQFALVAIATAIEHKFWVFLAVYFLGYLPQKFSSKVKMDYHAATLLGCTIQSVASFYVVCAVVPDLSISIFFPILAGAGFVAALVWFQKQIQRKSTLEELEQEDIEYLIRKAGLADRDKDIAEMFWVKHLTSREVASELDIAESTVKLNKKIIRAQLESARI